jgi:transcriptional regulator with XRE-family HTH domain
MRLFSDRVGISPSYIHDVEQGITLPSPEKLEAITSVLRDVALEQGADPELDTRELFRAREHTVYVERLGIDPDIAQVFIALRELDGPARDAIREPVLTAIGFFAELGEPRRNGVGRVLLNAIAAIRALPEHDRGEAGMQIADAVQKVLDTIRPPHEPAALAIDDDSEPSEAGAGTVSQ